MRREVRRTVRADASRHNDLHHDEGRVASWLAKSAKRRPIMPSRAAGLRRQSSQGPGKRLAQNLQVYIRTP